MLSAVKCVMRSRACRDDQHRYDGQMFTRRLTASDGTPTDFYIYGAYTDPLNPSGSPAASRPMPLLARRAERHGIEASIEVRAANGGHGRAGPQ